MSTATACAAAAATAAVILGMLTLAKAIALTDEARCVVEATPPHHISHSNRGFYLVTGWKWSRC